MEAFGQSPPNPSRKSGNWLWNSTSALVLIASRSPRNKWEAGEYGDAITSRRFIQHMFRSYPTGDVLLTHLFRFDSAFLIGSAAIRPSSAAACCFDECSRLVLACNSRSTVPLLRMTCIIGKTSVLLQSILNRVSP